MQSLKHATALKVGEQLLTQSPEQRAQTLSKLPQELRDTIKEILIYKYQVPLAVKTNSQASYTEFSDLKLIIDFIADQTQTKHCWMRETPLDNNLYLYNCKTDKHLTLLGHTDIISCEAISADDKYFLTGSYDSTARLWTIATGHSIVLSEHTGPVNDVYLSPDNTRAITGSEDTTVRLWDITQPQPVCTTIINHPLPVTKLHINHNGNVLFAGLNDGTIVAWNIAQAQPIQQRILIPTRPNTISTITVSSDHRFVISGSLDGHITLWDLNSEYKLTAKLSDTYLIGTFFVKRQEDIAYFIAAYAADKKLRIFSIAEVLKEFSFEEIITRIQQI